MVTVLAQRDAAAAALGGECSNNRGAVQKTEAPQKPRKADDERSKIHHYIYMCVCLCVCVCVSMYPMPLLSERQISAGLFKNLRPPAPQSGR